MPLAQPSLGPAAGLPAARTEPGAQRGTDGRQPEIRQSARYRGSNGARLSIHDDPSNIALEQASAARAWATASTPGPARARVSKQSPRRVQRTPVPRRYSRDRRGSTVLPRSIHDIAQTVEFRADARPCRAGPRVLSGRRVARRPVRGWVGPEAWAEADIPTSTIPASYGWRALDRHCLNCCATILFRGCETSRRASPGIRRRASSDVRVRENPPW